MTLPSLSLDALSSVTGGNDTTPNAPATPEAQPSLTADGVYDALATQFFDGNPAVTRRFDRERRLYEVRMQSSAGTGIVCTRRPGPNRDTSCSTF